MNPRQRILGFLRLERRFFAAFQPLEFLQQPAVLTPGLEDLVLKRIQAFFTTRDLRLEHIQLVSGSFLFDLPQMGNGVSLDKACSDAVVLLSFVCLMLGIADDGFELLVIFAVGKLSKVVQSGHSSLSSALAACYRQL